MDGQPPSTPEKETRETSNLQKISSWDRQGFGVIPVQSWAISSKRPLPPPEGRDQVIRKAENYEQWEYLSDDIRVAIFPSSKRPKTGHESSRQHSPSRAALTIQQASEMTGNDQIRTGLSILRRSYKTPPTAPNNEGATLSDKSSGAISKRRLFRQKLSDGASNTLLMSKPTRFTFDLSHKGEVSRHFEGAALPAHMKARKEEEAQERSRKLREQALAAKGPQNLPRHLPIGKFTIQAEPSPGESSSQRPRGASLRQEVNAESSPEVNSANIQPRRATNPEDNFTADRVQSPNQSGAPKDDIFENREEEAVDPEVLVDFVQSEIYRRHLNGNSGTVESSRSLDTSPGRGEIPAKADRIGLGSQNEANRRSYSGDRDQQTLKDKADGAPNDEPMLGAGYSGLFDLEAGAKKLRQLTKINHRSKVGPRTLIVPTRSVGELNLLNPRYDAISGTQPDTLRQDFGDNLQNGRTSESSRLTSDTSNSDLETPSNSSFTTISFGHTDPVVSGLALLARERNRERPEEPTSGDNFTRLPAENVNKHHLELQLSRKLTSKQPPKAASFWTPQEILRRDTLKKQHEDALDRLRDLKSLKESWIQFSRAYCLFGIENIRASELEYIKSSTIDILEKGKVLNAGSRGKLRYHFCALRKRCGQAWIDPQEIEEKTKQLFGRSRLVTLDQELQIAEESEKTAKAARSEETKRRHSHRPAQRSTRPATTPVQKQVRFNNSPARETLFGEKNRTTSETRSLDSSQRSSFLKSSSFIQSQTSDRLLSADSHKSLHRQSALKRKDKVPTHQVKPTPPAGRSLRQHIGIEREEAKEQSIRERLQLFREPGQAKNSQLSQYLTFDAESERQIDSISNFSTVQKHGSQTFDPILLARMRERLENQPDNEVEYGDEEDVELNAEFEEEQALYEDFESLQVERSAAERDISSESDEEAEVSSTYPSDSDSDGSHKDSSDKRPSLKFSIKALFYGMEDFGFQSDTETTWSSFYASKKDNSSLRKVLRQHNSTVKTCQRLLLCAYSRRHEKNRRTVSLGSQSNQNQLRKMEFEADGLSETWLDLGSPQLAYSGNLIQPASGLSSMVGTAEFGCHIWIETTDVEPPVEHPPTGSTQRPLLILSNHSRSNFNPSSSYAVLFERKVTRHHDPRLSEDSTEEPSPPTLPSLSKIPSFNRSHQPTEASQPEIVESVEKPVYDAVKLFTSPVHANLEAKTLMLEWYAGFVSEKGYLEQIEKDLDLNLSHSARLTVNDQDEAYEKENDTEEDDGPKEKQHGNKEAALFGHEDWFWLPTPARARHAGNRDGEETGSIPINGGGGEEEEDEKEVTASAAAVVPGGGRRKESMRVWVQCVRG